MEYPIKKYIKKPIKSILKIFNNKYFVLVKWYFTKNPLPKTNGTFLHIGCGAINYSGFINIDRYPFPHVHYIRDAQNLKSFKDNSIDLIYISHCLEHFSYRNLPEILNNYYRVLKPNGILRISVPDFDKILFIYNEENTIESIQPLLMGNQDYKYNFHYASFNETYLRNLLNEAGFKIIKLWEFGSGQFKDLPDWSGKKVNVIGSNTTYEISLNIEGIK